MSKIKRRRVALIILVALLVEGIANQVHDFRINENYARLLNLEQDMDKVSKPDDLILINSADYPTPMYFAHRKGWVNRNEFLLNEDYLNDLKEKGLKYIVILKQTFGNEILMEQYSKVLDNADYAVYSVSDSK